MAANNEHLLRKERKIIFLDFDGVMDNGKYDLYLNKNNLPEKDEFGVLFDPDCIAALKYIINETKQLKTQLL